MRFFNRNGNPVSPEIVGMAKATWAGQINRREFLATASAFGATAATAYAMIGLAPPAAAQSAEPKRGGILRVASLVKEQKDPRTFDWTEMSNMARTVLEPLIKYGNDATFQPMLLESWEVSDNAKDYTLHLRRDVTWNNGDVFNADDVIFNLTRWCDKTAEGNSMAGRLVSMIDEKTGKLRDGSVERLDDHTIRIRLQAPDISIIPGFADYPALIVNRSYEQTGSNFVANPIGTGPFELVSFDTGTRCVVKRRENGKWWGGEAHLDGIEFIDYGTDPAAMVSAFEAGEVDTNYETTADYVSILNDLGMIVSEAVTANTIVARTNVNNKPYDDQRVRNALQLAVDNAVVLQLGYANAGSPAENHHVCPVHPEYAELPLIARNVERARQLLEEAGQLEFEHELITNDEDWHKNTGDAIAAQLRDAGIKVKRTVLPGTTFWNDWTKYPFSMTNWAMRPLGIQVLAVAYRSGEAWNESAYSNPELDAKIAEALTIVDVEKRRAVMADIEKILQDAGVIIQPYWRKVYIHHAPRVKNHSVHPSLEQNFEEVWLEDA